MTLPPTVVSPSEHTKPAHQHYNTNTNESPQDSGVVSHFGVTGTWTPQNCQCCGESRTAALFATAMPTPPEHALPALLDDCGTFEPRSTGGARPFSPHDAHDPSAGAAPDAAAPAHGAPGLADPFHFDWPHW